MKHIKGIRTLLLTILLTPLSISHAASESILPLLSSQLQEINSPQPYKKAVVISHGWHSSAYTESKAYNGVGTDRILPEWPMTMAAAICDMPEVQGVADQYSIDGSNGTAIAHSALIRICSGQNWDVWVVDWADVSGSCGPIGVSILGCSQNPEYAFRNAGYIGDVVGHYLEDLGYNHLHLIAHSAGSQVIDTAKAYLKRLPTAPSLQMTFLDPYDPRADDSDISRYGSGSDWVDNYLDTSNLAGSVGDFFAGLKDPRNILISGYNIDVTGALSGEFKLLGHSHPYKVYKASITDRIRFAYGFSYSLEAGGTLEVLDSLKPNRTCHIETITNTCDSITVGQPSRTVEKDMCIAGSSDCPGVVDNYSATGSTSAVSENSAVSIDLATESSPNEVVGLFLQQVVPDDANHVVFDYRFEGDGFGIAIFNFDGERIGFITSALSQQGAATIPAAWLGDDVLGGPHSFGAILVNPLGGHASLHISNIRFQRKAWSHQPEPLTVSGTDQTSDSTTLRWSALRGGAQYVVELNNAQGNSYSDEIPSADAGCKDEKSVCQWHLPATLTAGEAQWRVMAKNKDSFGDWSDWNSFIVTVKQAKGDTETAPSAPSGGGSLSFLILMVLASSAMLRKRPRITALHDFSLRDDSIYG